MAIEGLPTVDDDACYQAMDRLLAMESKLAEQVYWAVADLLNLEVDLLFFDTTSTYFETGQADEALARDQYGQRLAEPGPQNGEAPTDTEEAAQRRGFRAFGKSKDHRDDLPQVIIGMAVTRTGIPIRVWSWPGATSDSALIRQVKDELKEGCVSSGGTSSVTSTDVVVPGSRRDLP